MPLLSAVEIAPGRGFDVLRHHNGRLAVRVTADVDPGANNSNAVVADLVAGPLPAIVERHGVEWTLKGRQEEQSETLTDMALGAVLALALIYLVLAFVFASYGWPLVVMSVIPFALIGAILGHWLLGIDLTILSMFGLFGLAGIVVNDSIILVTFYKALKQSGAPWREAIVEAACLRLRAVLLTSLTTIGGLTPLMFETSLQAQFLIPMAVSIAFGPGGGDVPGAAAGPGAAVPARGGGHPVGAARGGSGGGGDGLKSRSSPASTVEGPRSRGCQDPLEAVSPKGRVIVFHDRLPLEEDRMVFRTRPASIRGRVGARHVHAMVGVTGLWCIPNRFGFAGTPLPRCVFHPEGVTNMVTSIILMNVERALVNDIAERLADQAEISEVYSVSGSYDLVAIVRVAHNDDLAKLVTERLTTIGGITRTETMLAFRAYSRHDLEEMFAIGT